MVPDALSRLDTAISNAKYTYKSNKGVLNSLYGYAYTTSSLIKINPKLW